MTEDYRVLFGFNARNAEKLIAPVFREHDKNYIPFYVNSRIAIKEYLRDNPTTDALVIWDEMASGMLSADEICYLAEAYRVACIPILSLSWKGTPEIEKLYRRGILCAEFYESKMDGFKAEDLAFRIANLLLSGRDHESAKAYYGIVGRVL